MADMPFPAYLGEIPVLVMGATKRYALVCLPSGELVNTLITHLRVRDARRVTVRVLPRASVDTYL